MTPIDHENVGDQLVPYVRGELHADTAREVDEHLDSCADCRLELAAVRALLSDDVTPMSDIERTTLRRGIRQSVDVSTPATSGMAWLAPTLSVAALLLVVVLGMQFLGGVSGSDDAANGDADGGGGQEGALDAGEIDGPKPVTLRFTGPSFTRTTGVLSSGSADSEAAMPDEEPVQAGDAPQGASEGQPSMPKALARRQFEREADRLESRLSNYASTGNVFVSFARAYTAEDAEPLRDAFTASLLDDAPPGTGDQLVDCADFVAGARPSSLPVVAGHGRFGGKPALMLGFVWSEEPAGPLEEYMIFVWARGSCEKILHSQFGQIDT